MLIFDLVLATRRPVMTGVERYGANLFVATRARRPDTLAIVRDPSLFSDQRGLIAVGDVYRSWFTLPLELRRRGLRPEAVVFPTAPASPLFLATKTKLARVAHDVFPWTRADAMPWKGRLLFRDVETLMSRRYDLFCGTTEIVAQDLREQLKRADIEACGNAPGLDFSKVAEVAPADAPKEFILVVGTVEPRKDYARLIDLIEAGAPGAPPVVLVGRPGWGEIVDEIEDLAAARPDRLIWLRDLADDGALLWLYRRAACLLSLSRAEGFNAPLAEAAMCGRPVLCSDLPIHRSVAPPWARFASFSATPRELWTQLEETISDRPALEAVDAYRQRYSWDAVAERLLRLLDAPGLAGSVKTLAATAGS